MIVLQNVKEDDRKRDAMERVVTSILSSKDGRHVEEIYAKTGSFLKGYIGSWVGLMIELSLDFQATDLYDVLNDLEEDASAFDLVISTESNTVERGQGTVLWKKEVD